MKTIALYVDLLKASGLTQKNLARELGISGRTYSKWVHGVSSPTHPKSKAAVAVALAKYGKKPSVPQPIPPATTSEVDATPSSMDPVPDFDPTVLKAVRKASGLKVSEFASKLGISSHSQYHRYETGSQARTTRIRKVLYDVCLTLEKLPEGVRLAQPPEGETAPQARSRGRPIISEDMIRDCVERFERIELADFEREIVTKALRVTAQEYGYVPRQLREAIVIVLARVRGHVPITSLFTLLSGIDT